MFHGGDCERVLMVNIVDISDAVFSVDAGQRIVAWNASAERLLGYRSDEVVGQRCHEVIACGERPAALCRSHCARVDKPSRRPVAAVDVTIRTREGNPRRLAMNTVVAHTPSGDPRIVHILRSPVAGSVSSPAPQVGHERAELGEPDRSPQSSYETFLPEPHLTHREREALRLLALGLSTAEIADSLGVSRITARNHITKVMDKLQVRTRLQAVVVASRRGLL